MVTEAVETMQDTTLQSSINAAGAGQLSLLGLSHLQVQGVPWACKRGCAGGHESHQGALPTTLNPAKELPH